MDDCGGCHLVGDKGYFASLTAFESLLVRNSRLIVPGNPEESAFVHLLEGRRMGETLTQMPIGGDPFAVMAERGETDITMEEIRDWIRDLEAPAVSTEPSADKPTVQRIGATHVELGLRDLLGLTVEDFYTPAGTGGVAELNPISFDNFHVRAPDRAPIEYSNFRVSTTSSRYVALGGGSAIASQKEQRDVVAGFVQALIPISQAWCGIAVRKTGNDALFTVATPATGMSSRDLVRDQIADWHMLFLATRADDAVLDELVDSVFAPLEAETDARTAWIGVCSQFIRHPLFVFY
jgi:hypothetical protein